MMPQIAWVWAGALACLAGLSLWLGLRVYDQFGLGATLTLIGLGLIAILSGCLMIMRRPDPVVASRETLPDGLSEAFEHGREASMISRDGRVLKANKAYMEIAQSLGAIGVSEAPPSLDKLFGGHDKDTTSAIFRLHHLEDTERYAEETIHHKSDDGVFRTFSIQVMSLRGIRHWIIKDVSDTASRNDVLLSDVPIGLFSVDQDGQILATNTNLDQWIGAEENAGPKTLREFIHNPDVLLGSPRTPGRIVRADTRLITRKGVVTPTVMVAAWQEIGEDNYVANVALHGHSTYSASRARPAANSNVAGAEGMPAMSADDVVAAPFAILELDGTNLKTARIQRANAAFEAMSGAADWQDKSFADIFKSGTGSEFLSRDASICQADGPFDAALTQKDDTDLDVSTYIVAGEAGQSARVFLVDISARKALEDQLIQSQKMQAIGRIAAEVAHDFNNLLGAMRLYADTLLGRHPIGDPSYPELQQINSNINRAAELVKKLLAYSRKQTLRAVKLDVTETLSDMSITLKQVLGERVNLDIVHGRDLPPIKADKNQLDTVLMNLGVNARDAMKSQGGGEIVIKSRKLRKADVTDTGLKVALEPIKAEDFVVISVADTGTGITDDIKSKIFEPFFTTKPQGEGTGLGLSTVYGIVQQSGGHLDVESELGVGTTFNIYFPAYDENDADAAAPVVETKKVRRPADLAGQGNILFVEDEDSVRIIAAKTLRKRGYKVIEACDGEEAYEILEDAETVFDLMISDVVMPGMDGPTLLKKGRSMLGEARIVFISGYAEEEFSELLSEEPDVTFLPKPFSLIELAEKVKSEIGESAVA